MSSTGRVSFVSFCLHARCLHPSSFSMDHTSRRPPFSDNDSPYPSPDISDHNTRLLLLSSSGDSDAVASLIANGVDVDVADSDNRTALHIASCMGHARLVDLLIRSGANVNAQDRWHNTPLSDAKHYGNEEVCKMLEAAGAHIPVAKIQASSDLGQHSESSADKNVEDNIKCSFDLDAQRSSLESGPKHEVAPGGFLHTSMRDAILSKAFNAKELEMLELCLRVPLVSIRVGKIQRQGRFLCPSSLRGYLNLRILPSSDLRLLFMGDDGVLETITDIRTFDMNTHVTLDMLDPDPSGRSFSLRVSDGGIYFFWQSERSTILGHELLNDMRLLLLQKPALSELTGVDASRLGPFVHHLEDIFTAGFTDINLCSPSSIGSYAKPVVGNRSIVQQFIGKRGILDPTTLPVISKRNATFSSSLHNGSHACITKPLPLTSCVAVCLGGEKGMEPATGVHGLSSVSSYVSDFQRLLLSDNPFSRQVISLPGISPALSSTSSLLPALEGVSFDSNCPPIPYSPIATSYLTPYYCPCPLGSSSLQYAIAPPCLTSVSDNISVSSSPFFTVKPLPTPLTQVSFSLDRVNVSPIPAPFSSLVTIPTPLQASTLPSSFSDPIVHIPVMDFQSANQTFLVSMPQAISACGVSPMVPSFLGSIIHNGERLLRQEQPAVASPQCSGSEEDKDASDMQLLLINNRLRSLFASCTHFSKKDGVEQAADGSWCSRQETTRSSVVDSILQCSGPSVGMVPTVLSSGSPCACNFCPEMSTQPSPWVSGSRGLYGASCEPGLSSASLATFSQSLGMRSILGGGIFNILKNKGVLTETLNPDDWTGEKDDNSEDKGKE